jgi:acetyl esterase
MNRRTRVLAEMIRRLPRPDPPSPRYLASVRRELPPPLARLVLGRLARDLTISDIRVPTADAELRVRTYRASDDRRAESTPLVVNLHGGGFVIGNLRAADWLCGNVAARTHSLVASVEYRLAPEHPAPVPFLDSWAATQWLVNHGTELGVDPERVSVMGESAGGNLAALMALQWRDRCRTDPFWPKLVRQILIYPATDLTLSSASVADLDEAPMLGRTQLDWYGRCYLPQGLASSIGYDDPRVSPLFASDHRDLAPALIIAAGLDPLRDDATRYADTLRRAAVPTQLVTYPEAIHGFLSLPLFEPAAREALELIVRELGAAG